MPFEAGQLSFHTKVKLINRTRGSAAMVQKVIVLFFILLEHSENKLSSDKNFKNNK